jgi:hypothetical protein
MGEALWPSRLRWRLRGATQWPAFAVAVVVDAVLLDRLPVGGDDGPGLFAAVLLAGFLNLFVVAVCAPLVGAWLLRRRHPGTPKVVRDDQAATALLVAVAIALAAVGVAHRPAVNAARADADAQALAARRFILSQAPAAFQVNVDRMSVWKQRSDLYRTCVPGPDPRRAFCVFVVTDQSPPGVTRDRDQRPNATVRGVGG